tara:strand:- start:580 stop:1320 length:741 start_codon:yes stop_codon:yes gene_type:complete
MERFAKGNRKIRVAYISPDFFTHSVSYFIEAILKYADKERFEVFCYANVVKEDTKTALLKSFVPEENWKAVSGKAAEAVANLIRDDKIDILVELTGHTAGNRLDVVARKPAPIQVTMIGYPNTTGLPTVDYRITDGVADPPNTSQKFVEKLVRLPECFLCYTPTKEPIEISPAPCLNNNFITFGSFNNLAKITDEVLCMWASVLIAVPKSILLLKCKPFVNQKTRERVGYMLLIFSILSSSHYLLL